MNQLQLKIIETFSKIDHYREQLENVFIEMRDILADDLDGYEKRSEAGEFRKKIVNIKNETSKYFDCVDGLRASLRKEARALEAKMEKIDRAEQSIKRMRKISENVVNIKSSSSKKDIEEIERLFKNIKEYMRRHLSYVK